MVWLWGNLWKINENCFVWNLIQGFVNILFWNRKTIIENRNEIKFKEIVVTYLKEIVRRDMFY